MNAPHFLDRPAFRLSPNSRAVKGRLQLIHVRQGAVRAVVSTSLLMLRARLSQRFFSFILSRAAACPHSTIRRQKNIVMLAGVLSKRCKHWRVYIFIGELNGFNWVSVAYVTAEAGQNVNLGDDDDDHGDNDAEWLRCC